MAQPDSEAWASAGRRLLIKAVEEFAYEELLVPVPDSPEAGAQDPGEASARRGEPCRYRLDLGKGVHWTFRADRGSFATWHVQPGTLRRHPPLPGSEGPEQLLLDARDVLGWDGPTTAEVLRELIATRRAEAVSLSRALPAADLADLGYLELEAHQDGHPCMLLNKGRLGFSASDADAYAPESASPLRLVWTAVHRSLARYSGVPGLDAQRLLAEELDQATRERFTVPLRAHVVDPEEYVWLPVHPFHWDEAVVPLFASYLADGRIIRLGQSDDRYVPLQSIRTLANVDRPGRRNVKMPLMIRNTLVWRGLSTEPTAAAPDISTWLQRLRANDPFLRDEVRFHPLGEVASVAVRHPLYEAVGDAPYRYHELLGAVWREPVSTVLRGTAHEQGPQEHGQHDRPRHEHGRLSGEAQDPMPRHDGHGPQKQNRESQDSSRPDCEPQLHAPEHGKGAAGGLVPVPELSPATTRNTSRCGERQEVDAAGGERARTMAALLTTGSDGRALAAELVARSGLPPHRWLERLFASLLPGLLHYLYRYGVAFCPHGENTVVLFDASDVPVGVALKDFAEDVNLLPRSEQDAHPEYLDLSERADRVLLRWPAHELAHSLLSAVFAGHFRFFAPLAARHLAVPEGEFWALVRAEIERYHARFPELSDRFASFGLLAPVFDKVALNREQLLGGRFHDRAERDEGFDVVHGTVANPLVAQQACAQKPPAQRCARATAAGDAPGTDLSAPHHATDPAPQRPAGPAPHHPANTAPHLGADRADRASDPSTSPRSFPHDGPSAPSSTAARSGAPAPQPIDAALGTPHGAAASTTSHRS